MAEEVVEYTLEDMSTEKPYAEIFAITDPFKQKVRLNELAGIAKKLGFSGFRTMYREYVKSQQTGKQKQENPAVIKNAVRVRSPYPTFETGGYKVDDDGVTAYTINGEQVICHHPIFPIEILRNIETGEERMKIAYRIRGEWHELTVPKDTIYNSRKISGLSGFGLDITSENAKDMVIYFQEMEAMNRDALPLKKLVSRLGGFKGLGFVPFVDDIELDSDKDFGSIWNAINCNGSFNEWIEIANECRKKSVTAKILLAASFASVLVEPFGALPFIVHLWGVDSGTGKTVALMLAASVWADPDMGKYIQTFNSTEVGQEYTAAFLHDLPYIVDELQLARDSKGRSNFNVYKLAQGVGRTRGTKGGGISATPTWRNAILTTGETPLVKASAGAGAVNRVIDIECTADKVVIEDGMRVANSIRQNYGWAGRTFVSHLSPQLIEQVRSSFNEDFKALCELGTTEKQAGAAALILTADMLARAGIFGTDAEPLTVKEISTVLKTKESVSAGERGYAYLCDWVAMNANRFSASKDENRGEVYGDIDGNVVYIIRAVFRRALEDQGFDERALLSWLKARGLIITRGRKLTMCKRIMGNRVECVTMKLPAEKPEFCKLEELDDSDDEFTIL
jgi:hypothetical protein